MEKSIEELFEEKLRVALNLIRTNSTGTDVLQITQGIRNLVDSNATYLMMRGETKTKKQGASAS